MPAVTPYVGVWIETSDVEREEVTAYVTPYVGVWIETPGLVGRRCYRKVTPYVGVWIETHDNGGWYTLTLSLLMWECGLKPCKIRRG